VLINVGCRYLQIDDTTIAMMGDPKVSRSSATTSVSRCSAGFGVNHL